MEFTTIEKLQMKVSATYGAVLQYGDKVLVTDIRWQGGFTAEIFEFVESPKETGLGNVECRLSPWKKASEIFKDSGHAVAWCLAQIKKICSGGMKECNATPKPTTQRSGRS